MGVGNVIITGVTGQDGSYLADYLLETTKYVVHGVARFAHGRNLDNIQHLVSSPRDDFILHYGDVTDANFVGKLVRDLQPVYVFHLAAQSHVGNSFCDPSGTWRTNVNGTFNVLEAVRNYSNKTRVYVACSSEQYGNVLSSMIKEDRSAKLGLDSPMEPVSPYGLSKLVSYRLGELYRSVYNLWVVCGVLFNHEGPGRRGRLFVTRKIAKAVVEISQGKRQHLTLGNMHPVRDWGYAPDYVRGMVAMMRYQEPRSWILATGEGHTVWEYWDEACRYVGIDPDKHLIVDKQLCRSNDIEYLIGDASETMEKLSWQPTVKFRELVRMMVDTERKLLQENTSSLVTADWKL